MRVAVVGRGIAGLAVAYYLRAAGADVDVFGPDLGEGDASYAAHGFSIHKGLLLPESPFFRAKMRGQALLWEWIESVEAKTGEKIPRQKGLLEPYWSHDDYQKVAQRVYRRDFTGCFRVEGVPGSPEWRSLFSQPPLGAFRYSEDYWFNPQVFLRSLESLLQKWHVKFTKVHISRVQRASAKWALKHGSDHYDDFDNVVLAAGAGCCRLLEDSGLKSLAIRESSGSVIMGSLNFLDSPTLLTRFGSGAIVGPDSRVSISKDMESSMVLEDILASSVEYFRLRKDLMATNLVKVSGTRVKSRDRIPVVGALGLDGGGSGLFVMTGLNRNGMELAPGCAMFLRSLILNERVPEAQPELAFDPNRLSIRV
jgi:glycine/D-amino acid oxidase-like deaminating enzyme